MLMLQAFREIILSARKIVSAESLLLNIPVKLLAFLFYICGISSFESRTVDWLYWHRISMDIFQANSVRNSSFDRNNLLPKSLPIHRSRT